jgi:hypothetical protein
VTSSVPDEPRRAIVLDVKQFDHSNGVPERMGAVTLRCDRAVCEHAYHLTNGPLPVLVCAHCTWWTGVGRGKPATCPECRNHHGRDVALQPALMQFTQQDVRS